MALRTGRTESRLNHATAWVSLLAGVLTLAVAILGVFTYQTAADRERLRSENDALQSDIDKANARVLELNKKLDALQKSVEPSAAATGDSTTAGGEHGASQEAALADEGQQFISAIESFDVVNSVSINGKTFADAFTYTYTDCDTWCGNASVDLNLARRYKTLTGRIGVLDDSKGNGDITVRLVGDGKTLLTRTVSLGKSYDMRLSVDNVLRLRILATATYGAPGGTVAIGDPRVSS